MKHIICGLDASTAKIAILIKDSCFTKSKIISNYITPTCISLDQFIIFNLKYQEHNKCTAAYAKEYLAELLPVLDDLQIKILLVADPLYFKYLTKNNKAEPYYGYVCETNITPYNHIQVILVPNYQAVLYNPLNQAKIDLGLKALESLIQKTYTPPGTDIIHSEYYPETPEEINVALYQLLHYKKLTCDIETKSLEFWNAGLSTISFAWNQHEGVAFAIDRGDNPHIVRGLLKTFLQQYTGILIYHNVGYDAKVLIYELWMKNLQDYPNMLKGINCLTKRFDDTKLITFLATNNAIENKLGLKYLAQEFAGNYAQEDIANTDNIPLPELLRYNLIDCLSTWYVYNKYTPIMLDDQQEDLYFDLFKPTVKTLLQTELCGMPISPSKVQIAKQALSTIVNNCHIFLATSQVIKDFHHQQLIQKAKDKTALAKKKIYTIQDSVIACEFNPNSGPQLQALIYDYLNYPVLDLTDTKLPATGMKTLAKLINHAICDEHKQIFETLIRLTQADKILTTFIPAFENAQQLPDGSWRLYGNFNLGGTQSMRLSSCLIGESMVQCTSGLKQIKDIVIGDSVPTHDGSIQNVLNIFNNGIQPVYQITLENGESITCTSNHRLLTEKGFLSLEDLYEIKSRGIKAEEIRNCSPFLQSGETVFDNRDSNPLWSYQKNNTTSNSRMDSSKRYPKTQKTKSNKRTKTKRETKRTDYNRDVPRSIKFTNIERYTENCSSQIHINKENNSKTLYTRIHPEQNQNTLQQIQVWQQKSNERQIRKSSSQLQRSYSRWKGLFISFISKLVYWKNRFKSCFSTPCGYLQSLKYNRNTPRILCTSCGFRQDQQQYRQSCFNDSNSTPKITFRKSPIRQIKFMGLERVYDLEIQATHCYIANRIYVHNSNPNLQNIPSNSKFSKLIKQCFVSTDKWIFIGSDFSALESITNALITQDPNKQIVFTDGFDSHCLAAYFYFKEQMPDITAELQGFFDE